MLPQDVRSACECMHFFGDKCRFDLIEGMGLVLILGVTTLAGSHDAAELCLGSDDLC